MEIPTPNPESDADFRERAIQEILREICRRFRETNNPSFTPEEIENLLRGINPNYLRFNLRDILMGFGLIEFKEDDSLVLTEEGRQHCRQNNR